MKSNHGAPHVHGLKSARLLSKKTWSDFETLFAANGGVWGGCWCMYFHAPKGWDSKAYERNKKDKHGLVNHGQAHGTIVYCGTDPVGWCQFGPREELPLIDRKRGYKQTAEDHWRITCLFIAPGHRKAGFGDYSVQESIKAMKELKVTNVEAYPVEGNRTASLLWSGTPGMFEDAGFKKVGPLGKNSWIYSLKLPRS